MQEWQDRVKAAGMMIREIMQKSEMFGIVIASARCPHCGRLHEFTFGMLQQSADDIDDIEMALEDVAAGLNQARENACTMQAQ